MQRGFDVIWRVHEGGFWPLFDQRGRPPGIRNYDEQEFRELLPRAIERVWARFQRRPRQVEVVAELGISTPTFKNYIKVHGVKWSDEVSAVM